MTKRYRRFRPDRAATLKDTVVRGFRGLFPDRSFLALDDVTFDVAPGRTVCVVGPNGAGKSSLLRLLGGVGRPDEGSIDVRGRVGALLELGVGFHPDLTGRENVVINGVIAGLTRAQIRRRMDDIVEFSELEDFIDSPLRVYSTGMRERLAFSTAVHLDPDVLLVDEVFAVGDVAFRQRCLDRIRAFQREGVTIVVVSHHPELVRTLADEALWLRGGRLIAHGSPADVLTRYVADMEEATRRLTPDDEASAISAGGHLLRLHENRFGSQEAHITGVRVLDGWGTPNAEVASGDAVVVLVDHDIPDSIGSAVIGVRLVRDDGLVCLDTSTMTDAVAGASRLDISRLEVTPGDYAFSVGLYSERWDQTYDYHHAAYPLAVTGAPNQSGILAPPLTWARGRVAHEQPLS